MNGKWDIFGGAKANFAIKLDRSSPIWNVMQYSTVGVGLIRRQHWIEVEAKKYVGGFIPT